MTFLNNLNNVKWLIVTPTDTRTICRSEKKTFLSSEITMSKTHNQELSFDLVCKIEDDMARIAFCDAFASGSGETVSMLNG